MLDTALDYNVSINEKIFAPNLSKSLAIKGFKSDRNQD